MISKLIKKADLLVDPYEFNISQKEKSLTPIGIVNICIQGGFISILLIVFTTFYIVGIFERSIQNQNSIYAGTQSDQSIYFTLNNKNTYFALEISNLDGKSLSNTINITNYFTLQVQYIQQQRVVDKLGFTRNYSVLNQTKCSQSRVEQFNFDPASLTDDQKQNLICFDGDFSLQGQFYEPYFAYIKISVQACNNVTNSQCKSTQEITNFINTGVDIDLFIKGSQIKQQLNETYPADTFATDIFWRLNTGIGDNEDLYIVPVQMNLKKITFFSDLFNVEETQNIFSGSVFQRSERRQNPISVAPKVELCTFYLRASLDSSYYFVNQQDFLSIILSSISEATALCLALMQIVKIVYKFYNQHKTFEILMNSVFKFDLKSVQLRKNSFEQSKTPSKNPQRLKTTTGKLQKILDYTISYSFFRFILYQFRKCLRCCWTKEQEKELIISQIAKSKIEFDLDLTNILKKLYEIDCLKLFLFDDDQLMLFNSFCSPVFQDQMSDQQELFAILTTKQNRSLNSLQQAQKYEEQNQQLYQFAATSTIPITVRLAKLTRFFKAQLGAEDAQGLVDNFQRLIENKNKNCQLNQQLIEFAQQNKSLFNLVQQHYNTYLKPQQNEGHSQNSENHQMIPNELDDPRKPSDAAGSKDSANSLKDLEVQQSLDLLKNRLHD